MHAEIKCAPNVEFNDAGGDKIHQIKLSVLTFKGLCSNKQL